MILLIEEVVLLHRWFHGDLCLIKSRSSLVKVHRVTFFSLLVSLVLFETVRVSTHWGIDQAVLINVVDWCCFLDGSVLNLRN